MSSFHIDYFSALDDLPKKDRGNPIAVLSLLAKVGRFSCFEMEGKLAGSMDTILKSDWLARTWGEYPWTYVELSEEGRQVVAKYALVPEPRK